MKTESLARGLRTLLGTLTVVSLLGVGAAVAATKFEQANLEDEAVESARKLAVSTLEPVLQPRDAERPLARARYASLLSVVRDEVLPGPITDLRLWRDDGTVLFADERELVGRKQTDMRETIDSLGSASAMGGVEGERFRTLVPLSVGKDGTSVTAELGRSHAQLVGEARERWWPWVGKLGRIAAIAFGLYLAIVAGSAVLAAQRRRRGSAKRSEAIEKATSKLRRGKPKDGPAGPDAPFVPAARSAHGGNGSGEGPAYLQPGFQELVEAKRQAEDALVAAEQERARLQERLHAVEAELEEARRRLATAGAAG